MSYNCITGVIVNFEFFCVCNGLMVCPDIVSMSPLIQGLHLLIFMMKSQQCPGKVEEICRPCNRKE